MVIIRKKSSPYLTKAELNVIAFTKLSEEFCSDGLLVKKHLSILRRQTSFSLESTKYFGIVQQNILAMAGRLDVMTEIYKSLSDGLDDESVSCLEEILDMSADFLCMVVRVEEQALSAFNASLKNLTILSSEDDRKEAVPKSQSTATHTNKS